MKASHPIPIDYEPILGHLEECLDGVLPHARGLSTALAALELFADHSKVDPGVLRLLGETAHSMAEALDSLRQELDALPTPDLPKRGGAR